MPFVAAPCVTARRRILLRPRGSRLTRACPRRSAAGRRSVAISASATAPRVLWAEQVRKTHDGDNDILPPTSLSVPRGAKLAVLGPNGAGKSTLLSILAGLQQPDDGQVSRLRGVTVAHVAQELPEALDLELPAFRAVLVLAAAHAPTPSVRAALRYAQAGELVENAEAAPHLAERRQPEQNQPVVDNALLEALAEAAAAMDTVPGAWEIDSYLATAMTRLQVPRATPLRQLSGGQQRRVAIAAALVARPDVLLLDEVTNHLSVEGIEFLEDVLQDPSLTVVAISHDRYFVDKVCTTGIWELDGGLHQYPPGYQVFLKEKAERVEREKREADDLARAFRREAEWMRRQPKARSTKARYRVDEVERMESELKDRKDRLKKTEVKDLGQVGSRLGGEVVRLENVTLHRGDNVVLKDFSYTFERGERVGICGGNGVGKSSFLKAILGQLPLEAGSIHVGDTVVFGHFDQDGINLSTPLSEASRILLDAKGTNEQRVIDYVGELVSLFGDGGTEGAKGRKGDTASGDSVEARLDSEIAALSHSVAMRPRARGERGALSNMQPMAILDQFGFARAKQHTFVSRLSGGEKRRLQLMGLLLRNPNFLLLDEVSNDLDVNTLTMLEELLLRYSGVLVLCSHDRFMLDRLVDHLLVFDGAGGVEAVEGKVTDYLAGQRERSAEEKRVRGQEGERKMHAQAQAQAAKGEWKKKRRLSFKERREYEGLEQEIDEAQARWEEVSRRLERGAATAGYSELAEWSEELARTESEIERMSERWLELAEVAGD